MTICRRLICAASALTLLVSGPSFAAADDPSDNQEIVVQARLSGAPIWEVTHGESTVLLVGAIKEIPKATPWRPERLEAATKRAQSVVLEAKASVSAGTMFRVMFKLGKLLNLPKGKTAADYLSAAQLSRLAALEAAGKASYQRRSFMITAHQLLRKQLDFNHNTGKDVADVVRSTARGSSIPVRPVGTIKGGDLLESLLTAPPASHIPCLEAAMSAVEAGPEIVEARGDAWTHFNIPAVMDSKLEAALGSCWPWTDGQLGSTLRGLWVKEIGSALNRRGVTMAVVPLRVLAERKGLLDQLEQEGKVIKGPKWRTAPPAIVPATPPVPPTQ